MNDSIEQTIANIRYWNQRLEEQLKFAEKLCELHPEEDTRWRELIRLARAELAESMEEISLDALPSIVRSAEAVLSPIAGVAKTYTVNCVAHAHIDLNWMWSFPETVAVAHDTFTTVLSLMDEFPDFCFTQSQAAIYDLRRRFSPDLFSRIKRKIAEGRWEVAAASWVESDKNLACGEALARQNFFAREFCSQQLDLSPEGVSVQWEPDAFGHSMMIPAIATSAGVRCYYLCRGGDRLLPPVFWWRSPDGSRVLVNREIDWYNNWLDARAAEKAIEFCKATGLRDWMLVFGIGDHGGGPTRRDLRRLRELDAWPVFPRFRHATARSFFEKLLERSDRFPIIEHELNFEFSGCYSSQSSIKRANRLGENLLLETEWANAVAQQAAGVAYPRDTVREAWLHLLFNQFHDILPGSGARATREHALGRYQELSASAHMAKTHALNAIANAIDTSFAQPRGATGNATAARTSISFGAGAGRITDASDTQGAGRVVDAYVPSTAGHANPGAPVVVTFNPCAFSRREVARVTLWDGDPSVSNRSLKERLFVARGASGNVIPIQMIRDGQYWSHEFVELCFPVQIGAMGYASYVIEEVLTAPAPMHAPSPVQVHVETEGAWHVNQPAGRILLENEHLSVQFNRATGGIESLIEKATGDEFAISSQPLGVLEYLVEQPHDMTAWTLGDGKRRNRLEVESMRVEETGPYVATVVVEMRLNDSRVSVTHALQADSHSLDIEIRALWLERGSRELGVPKLMMRFPMNIASPRLRCEVPFGSAIRENNGREVPALRWVDVTGVDERGCTLANDCKYGYSLDGSTLSATLIRSSYDPDPLPEMGEHRMRFALAPHGKARSVAECHQLGAGFNHPLICINTHAHVGALPARLQDGLIVQPSGVVLTHIKPAAEGGLILRLQETRGMASDATIELNPQMFGRITSTRYVDLLERPVPGSAGLEVKNNSFAVQIASLGVCSVEVR